MWEYHPQHPAQARISMYTTLHFGPGTNYAAVTFKLHPIHFAFLRMSLMLIGPDVDRNLDRQKAGPAAPVPGCTGAITTALISALRNSAFIAVMQLLLRCGWAAGEGRIPGHPGACCTAIATRWMLHCNSTVLTCNAGHVDKGCTLYPVGAMATIFGGHVGRVGPSWNVGRVGPSWNFLSRWICNHFFQTWFMIFMSQRWEFVFDGEFSVTLQRKIFCGWRWRSSFFRKFRQW
jgi:hypothetical protein